MYQKELTIKNVYAFKNRISRYMKQITELKEKNRNKYNDY